MLNLIPILHFDTSNLPLRINPLLTLLTEDFRGNI